jgi:hypothetical protein
MQKSFKLIKNIFSEKSEALNPLPILDYASAKDVQSIRTLLLRNQKH